MSMAYGAIGYSEIVGALQEIVGTDDQEVLAEVLSGVQEFVGAVPPGMPRPSLANIANRRAVAVTDQMLTNKRLLFSGAGSTAIAAAATTNVTLRPQDLWRIQRISVPSNIAFDLVFNDVKVGQKSQFVDSGELPCASFSEVAVGNPILLDTANVGNTVILETTNVAGASRTFRAGIFGTAVR